MDILSFIKLFVTLLFVGSLVVTGWYFCTRGEENIMPDGSIEKDGMIFKAWYFFWLKKKEEKRKIFYQGIQLTKLVNEIKSNNPQLTIRINSWTIEIPNARPEEVYSIADKWNILALDKGGTTWAFYKEYDEYVFPEIIRMPIVQCVTCMASIYGTIFYWLTVTLIKEELFTWSKTPILASIVFWVFFCFCLSVINTAIVRKFH